MEAAADLREPLVRQRFSCRRPRLICAFVAPSERPHRLLLNFLPPCLCPAAACRRRGLPPYSSCTSGCLIPPLSARRCSSCRRSGPACWRCFGRTLPPPSAQPLRRWWAPLGRWQHRLPPLPLQPRRLLQRLPGQRLPGPAAAPLAACSTTGCCRCYSGGPRPVATPWRRTTLWRCCWRCETASQV